jgi:hypothetical protein
MTVPSGPEVGVKYSLTGPDGTVATFNLSTDTNYVGAITEATGLDSPETRENAENITGFDGGVHGNFYYGRRPIVLTGKIFNVKSNKERNEKITKLLQASNAMREDAVLEWTPEGGEAQFLNVRRAQPTRITGAFDKDFQLSLVSADPRIYSVTQNVTITGSTEWFNTAFVATTGQPNGITADTEHIYWCDSTNNSIGRAKLDGTSAELSFITGCHFPYGIAVDGSHIYWCNSSTNCIGRSTLAGGTVEQEWIKEKLKNPRGIAVNASFVYVAQNSGTSIFRATIAGATPEENFVATSVAPLGVAIDSGHIYWGTYSAGNIGRSTLAGGTIQTTWISGLKYPVMPTVDASHVYWCDPSKNIIGRAAIGGTAVEEAWQSVGGAPYGVAVNASSIYVSEYTQKAIGKGPLNPPTFKNEGSNATYPKLIISGKGENPRIRNNTTGQELALNYKLSEPSVNFTWQVLTTYASKGALAIDKNFLYWNSKPSGAGQIGRIRLDGTEKNPTWHTVTEFFTKLLQYGGLVVQEPYLYWTEYQSGTISFISRTELSTGTTLREWAICNNLTVGGIASDENYIYTARNTGHIARIKLSNAAVEETWINAGENVTAIAVDASHIYWATLSGEEIKRAAIAGTGAEKFFATTSLVKGLAVDAGHIYWVADKATEAVGLGRATIAGGSIENKWIPGGTLQGSQQSTLLKGTEGLYWIEPEAIARLITKTENKIELDTLNRTVKSPTGEQLYRILEFPQSEWFGLAPGSNSISLIAAGEETKVEVIWRNAWI